jgi:hypothetical protein
MAEQSAVADAAEKAAAARKAGKQVLTIGWVRFDLATAGMCSQFTRECSEAAAAVHEHTLAWFGANAVQTEALLKKAGMQVPVPIRGCLIALNRNSGANGHIAVVLSVNPIIVAENTISATRGDPRAPGTKITPLSVIEASKPRVTGYYLSVPGAASDGLEDWERKALAWGVQVGLDVSNPHQTITWVRAIEMARKVQAATIAP